jgi:ectoine hydroxylase-related dioxygenase (phytanoyl-CoA dioxygenase family)
MTMITMPSTERGGLAESAFPYIDAATQDCITDEQAQFFRDNGLLVIRNVLRGEELAAMQRETQMLVDKAVAGTDEPDYAYKTHEITGKRVPFRIEYIIDKTTAGKALLGNPFILHSVEKLQGPNFIPTWDAMVFKNEGAGVAIPWHRDAGTVQSREDFAPIFNVDFYLDPADLTNCLWGILGTTGWSQEQANARIAELNDGGVFQTPPEAVPIPMQPGDVILHNILALHGSPAAQSKLRRVVYYEFRPAEIEMAIGPHRPEYLPLKQKLLLKTLEHRQATSYAQGEIPFTYRPRAPFDGVTLAPSEELPTYRYVHGDYWRK